MAVCSNVPGLKDSVVDGQTGSLFEYNNQSQYVEKVLALLKDEKKRKTLETNASAFAKTFRWETRAKKMRERIESVS